MHKISATIITYNEENNIARCLDSLQGIVDEIVVVDSFSKDRTKQICLQYGVKFLENPFNGHIEQKNFALTQASNNFILSLDADEALSEDLKTSILKVKKLLDNDAYSFNRLTSYCGQWIHHCGWYPDSKIRLINKTKGCWGGENPHDKIVMDEGVAIKHLKGDLLHYSYESVSSHIIQIEKFTNIAAKEAYRKGKKMNVLVHLCLYPFFIFLKKYFIQRGFLDGYYGFIVCSISAFGKRLKYIKLNELYRQEKEGSKGRKASEVV